MLRAKKHVVVVLLFVILATVPCFGPIGAEAAPVTLSNVPAYDWYHGCGPTAATSIIGYWDLHGYDKLLDASGWEQVRLTANVQDEISSPDHNAKYDPTPDVLDPPLPVPPDTSVADFFHTSEDPWGFGVSVSDDSADAFIGYAAYRGYSFDAASKSKLSFSWAQLVAEIDAGRPMLFMVDAPEQSGQTPSDALNHFVAVLGYDDRGGGDHWYGFWDTWTEEENDDNIVWAEFLYVDQEPDTPWDWGFATFVVPLSDPDPVPVPTTVLLLGSAVTGLIAFRRKRGSS